jgi:hypothetical protein
MFYRSIFTLVIVWFKRAWYIIFAYVVLNAVSSVTKDIFECHPVQHGWDEPLGRPGKCVNISAMEMSSGVILAVADLMLLVLPIPIIWSLRIPRRDKVMLCGLFTLGSL